MLIALKCRYKYVYSNKQSFSICDIASASGFHQVAVYREYQAAVFSKQTQRCSLRTIEDSDNVYGLQCVIVPDSGFRAEPVSNAFFFLVRTVLYILPWFFPVDSVQAATEGELFAAVKSNCRQRDRFAYKS